MTEREMKRRRAARKARERKARNRRVALTLCLMLAVCLASVGGTLAWLTATTTPVENTFSPSNIGLTLDETNKGPYKMVPGDTIEKDPKVTITTDVEAYLFVEITESVNLKDFITYAIKDEGAENGWTRGTGTGEGKDGVPTNVIYRTVAAGNNNAKATHEFYLLTGTTDFANGHVEVKAEDVTKAMMDALEQEGATQPTLTFTAYAIQKHGFDTAAAAWTEVSK